MGKKTSRNLILEKLVNSKAICFYLILFIYPPIQIEVLALQVLLVCFLASSLFKFLTYSLNH